MDWADDVAYSVHDVEDGVHGGYIRLRPLLRDADERAALCARRRATSTPTSRPADLAAVLDELLADAGASAPLAGYDGSHRALAALKRLDQRAHRPVRARPRRRTREPFGTGPLRRYAADLVVPRRTRAECALLKGSRRCGT